MEHGKEYHHDDEDKMEFMSESVPGQNLPESALVIFVRFWGVSRHLYHL